ncbi:MAG: MBL fold metallo-hydrolase [Candidatus Riflebacteria bacterium]|nr:MBL fold metallo-hydrolase [Candidatus Riflebacteria bacterium]
MVLWQRVLAAALGAGLFAVASSAPVPAAEPNPARTEFSSTKVAENLWMLTGSGGNIGAFACDEGVALVDDDVAEMADKLKEAVANLSSKPVRYVINTHWHPDHVGGNESLRKAGAAIIAHHGTRRAMTVRHRVEALRQDLPPSPAGALPEVTFEEAITLHFGGEELRVFRTLPAHTGGDVIVYFRKANVYHAGDNFQTAGYPFVDFSTGGNINGMIVVAEQLRKHADAAAKLIPGHGPVGTKADVEEYLDMLVAIRDRVRALIRKGKTADEVVATKPSREFDERWGKAFLTGDQFVRLVYQSLTARSRQ